MKYICCMLLMVVVFHSSLQGKDSNAPVFSNSIRLSGFIGGVLAQSDDPHMLFGNSESATSLQNGFGIDYLHSFKYIKLGIGVGLSNRSDDYWKRYYNRYSKNIRAHFELGNNTVAHIFYFGIQFGWMQGSISKSYYPYIGMGPVFLLNNEFKKLNIYISPFILYQGGETKGKLAYDCRYSPPGNCNGTPYTLHFNTFSVNASLILQYNFLKKAK